MKCILITGAAGFIQSHLACSLLEKGYNIICIDNMHSHNSNTPTLLNII